VSDSGVKNPPIAPVLAALGVPVFRMLWIATLFSNVGTLMQAVASAWLMTSLTTSTTLVGLVQTAGTLPVFLVGILAGALADVFDRRMLLIFTQSWMLLAAGVLALVSYAGWMTPWVLLGLTFLLGLGAAFNLPAWQAMMQDIVPREMISSAVSLNSMGFNVARSVGPAIGGLIVAASGPGMVFLLNAVSFVAVLVVLITSRIPRTPRGPYQEDVLHAMQAGIRYVLHAPRLRAPLVRAAVFVFCGGSIWTLLPLLARDVLHTTAAGYGLLLSTFGIGSILAAIFVPRLRAHVELDRLVILASVLFSAVLLWLGLTGHIVGACVATFFAGVSWIAVLVNLNVAVQTTVPAWVRGRALSCYLLIFQGGLALAGAVWGAAAGWAGTSGAFLIAAGITVLGIGLAWRFRLEAAEALDLRPSMHWPEPVLAFDADPERTAVLITVEYQVAAARVAEFEELMLEMRELRLRDGARVWRLYRDADKPDRFFEFYRVDSWQEHLRQHTRMTKHDQTLEARVLEFHEGEAPPRVDHLISVAR